MEERTAAVEGYVGRFAPSPTGLLHYGSLVAALASYLDAKAHDGKWLVRIEDLDPPREIAGSSTRILEQLQVFALKWDGEVMFQSARLSVYEQILQRLMSQGFCFYCNCSRQRVSALDGIYDGRCRNRELASGPDVAVRVRTNPDLMQLTDRIQGKYTQNLEQEIGDFILKRKDGLFSYQLAVVADDAAQEITHVVRGNDLLASTPRQIYLQQLLGLPIPRYAHIPIVVNELGQKLSKQHFAQPIDHASASSLISSALRSLGMTLPSSLNRAAPAFLIEWGIEHWDIQRVPKLAKMRA